MFRFFLTILVFSWAFCVVPAADVNLSNQVTRLVQKLDAPRLAEREAAEAELLKLGPSILELLPEDNRHQSAEVQLRLARIRHRLEQLSTVYFLHPSAITLQAHNTPLSEILESIQQQSGNVCQLQLNEATAKMRLTLDFDKVPFWKAIDELADRANLQIHHYGKNRSLEISSAVATENHVTRSGSACYSGPFRIAPTAVLARRDPQTNTIRNLTVILEAAWEPRVQVIYLTHPMNSVTATDQEDRPVEVTNPLAQPEFSVGPNNTAVKIDIPLQTPLKTSKKIAHLSGKLSATIAGRIETFRFTNLATTESSKIAKKRIAAVTTTLEGVRRSGTSWEIRLRVRFDNAGDALASHRQWIFDNEAYLETVDKQKIVYEHYETTLQTRNELGIAYFFRTNESLEQLAFVYKTPGAIITADFPYELKNIALP